MTDTTPRDFIRRIIDEHNESGKYDGRVHTRFPPEPNGYLHIGHAKAIWINFGIAQEFGGKTNLRFDDTNPLTEEIEYVEAIQRDVRWLGCDWEDRLFFASDYFDQLYEYALKLVRDGKAYVDDLSADEIREYRGTLTEPGKNSPYRDRSVEENLDLFARMKAGEFPNGARVLRAKIDMASPNINMRDPVLYRIVHASHYRTGDTWCIYPSYDFTHGQSDSLERITHSLCSLEFEDHRPLYDWCIENLEIYAPQQIEFARLVLEYTMTSKRKLRRLIEDGYVSDWDDPRLATISGIRRRGFTPEAIQNFCDAVGIAKSNSVVEYEMLTHFVRQDLEQRTARAMGVLNPLKVVITNYPADQTEELEIPLYPHQKERDESRKVPFSNVIYIDRDDFAEVPPPKYFRLSPGREVRLIRAYYITCTDVIKDENGEVIEVHCTYDPESRGGRTPDKRKVKGTLHWVSAEHSLPAEVRLYEHLFTTPDPEEGGDYMQNLNPNSLTVLQSRVEPHLADTEVGERFQFMRKGYFNVDLDSRPGALVFNRTLPLRDSWAKKKK